MYKQEEITQFNGFGDGDRSDEYYYSQNMKKTRNGVSPLWKITKNADTSDLPTMTSMVYWYAQGRKLGTENMFAMDYDGNIYSSELGSGTYSLFYKPGITIGSGFNGMIVDQKGRLLCFGERYVCMYDPNLSNNYTTGTVSVTNGNNAITGSGTTWDSGMTGKRIRVGTDNTFYTFTYISATSGTLSSNYTGTTGSGLSYTIYRDWTDQWKDMGSSLDYAKPSDLYEDTVLIGAGNKIITINTIDDTINTAAFELPTEFTINDVDSGKNGILIIANLSNYSVAALWDNISDRAITDWIWYEGETKSIVSNKDNWIIFTSKGIFETNGYISAPIKYRVLDERFYRVSPFSYMLAQGAAMVRNKLVFWGRPVANNGTIRQKTGIYFLDLDTGLMEFVAVHNNFLYYFDAGAIGIYSSANVNYIHLSYNDGSAVATLALLFDDCPSKAIFISPKMGRGNTEKIAEAVKVNVSPNFELTDFYYPTFDISLKLYNFKRQICGIAQQKILATDYNKITVDGTTATRFEAEVGDEITVLHGDNAGEIRHITEITGAGTATEVWTLDTAFSNYTEANTYIDVSPFKLVKKYSFSSLTEMKDIYFDIKNKTKGRNFLIKIVLENLNSPIEIQGISFIYDDLGLI